MLVSLARSSTVMAGSAQRARIVLLAADGVSNTEIASRTGVLGYKPPNAQSIRRGICGDLRRVRRPQSRLNKGSPRAVVKDVTISHWIPDGGGPPLLVGATVGGRLREVAAEVPDRVALVEGLPTAERRRWTYAELLADAERCARYLLQHFEPGERVAVWAHNLPEWVLLEYGAALAGLTLVTVNPSLQPAEARYVLGASRAAGLFLVPEVRGNPLAAHAKAIRAELPELRLVLRLDLLDELMAASTGVATSRCRSSALTTRCRSSTRAAQPGSPKG